MIPVIIIHLLLPVAAAITGALYAWPVTGVMCLLSAAAGWLVFPSEALPVTIFWCAACGLTACLPLKQKLHRPALRAGMCLGAWSIGLVILLQVFGGAVVNGLARWACDAVERSPDSAEILLRAYSAGLIRLGNDALLSSTGSLGLVTIPAKTQMQMLLSLRASLEELLPSLLCGVMVWHTAVTVLLSTVVPDGLRRKRGETGEFAPMERWYMPRRMGMAVFALCIGWLVALLAEDGIGAYLGWLCAGIFRAAFIVQGICWMQWMGKRLGVRAASRGVWSVILPVMAPLIPMIMGLIDQSRDVRHLRPKEEADQE